MSEANVRTALTEFRDLVGYRSKKATACFFWSFWGFFEKEHEVRETILSLRTRQIKEITNSYSIAPDDDFVARALELRGFGEVIFYLMEQTIRLQYLVASRHITPNVHLERARLPNLERLHFSGRRIFWLSTRPAIPDEHAHYQRNRYIRRFLFPHVRIIPDVIAGGLPVEVHPFEDWPRQSSKAVLDPRLFEAACTYAPAVERDGEDVLLRLSRLTDGADARLEELLTACLKLRSETSGPDTMILWPELSVDKDIVKQLTRTLQDVNDHRTPRRSNRVRLVIPGTFYAEDDSMLDGPPKGEEFLHAPNRAWIIDLETGTRLFEQDKLKPFYDTLDRSQTPSGAQFVEAVLPGTEINIFISGWAAFCVFICKDFVDAEVDFTGDLDIDYALVPSMGKDTTFSAWHVKAGVLKRHWGAHSALALQAPPDTTTWRHVPSGADRKETT